MNKRLFTARLLFLALFFALVVAPAAKLNVRGERSLWENRLLAQLPRITRAKEIKTVPKKFEAWLQDRIGFREKTVSLYNQFYYYILQTSATRKIVVGRGGEIFLSDGAGADTDILLLNNLRGIEVLRSSGTISKKREEFIEAKRLADNLSIPSKAVVIPQKALLDARNLPYYIRKFMFTPPPPPFTQIFKESLPVDVSDWIIFPYEEAMRANDIHPLYPKMNYHWNIGGRYTKLMASIIASEFGVADYEEPGLEEFERCAALSDLSHIIAFTSEDKDQLCIKKQVFEAMGILLEGNGNRYRVTFLEKSLSHQTKYPSLTEIASTEYLYALNKNKPFAPKILWIGDSFSFPIAQDLARYFSEAVSINLNTIAYLKGQPDKEAWDKTVDIISQIAADYKPDYIVFASFSVVGLPRFFRVNDNHTFFNYGEL